jgi:threonine synthase
VFGETAAGVTAAGALALARAGRLRADDEVVLCITGHGLKTVEAVLPAIPEAPVIAPRLRDVIPLIEQRS